MEFDELINTGWSEHEKDSEGVAARLEEHSGLADSHEKAGKLLTLGIHTIGQHLADWPRAAILAQRVAGGLSDEAGAAGPLGHLALARYMTGDAAGALTAETRAASLADDPLQAILRVRALTVSALSDRGEAEAAAAIYGPTLAVVRAQSFEDDAPIVRTLAITSNNLASDLLELAERTDDQSRLMDQAAQAAREFWVRAGTWVNAERADYLLSMVESALGRHEEASACAVRGLQTIAENGDEKVDEAFLHLALATARRGAGDGEGHGAAIARAKELGAEFDAGLKGWFEKELAKAE